MQKSLVEITADLMAAIVAGTNPPQEDAVALYKRLYQAMRESYEDEARLRRELEASAPRPATSVSPLPDFPQLPFPFPFPNFSGMGWNQDAKPGP